MLSQPGLTTPNINTHRADNVYLRPYCNVKPRGVGFAELFDRHYTCSGNAHPSDDSCCEGIDKDWDVMMCGRGVGSATPSSCTCRTTMSCHDAQPPSHPNVRPTTSEALFWMPPVGV